jgi:hypothetical protein
LRPESFWSVDCLRQSDHLALSFDHSLVVAFHCLRLQFSTEVTADETDVELVSAALEDGFADDFVSAAFADGGVDVWATAKPEVMVAAKMMEIAAFRM